MNKRGFTLIEVVIVVTIIALLATTVMVSLGAIRARGRDAQRKTDIATILNAIYQYAVDNNNQLPSTITTTAGDICRTGAASCAGLVDLSVLTTNQQYLASMPFDPQSTSTTDTNYTIVKTSSGRITISAPNAEVGTSSITR